MPCNITAGITISCDALKRVGGLNKRLWLFNISSLNTPIVALTDGFVTDIPLTTYATLYKIEGNKYSHSFEVNEQRSDEGNVQWEHKLMVKIVNTTPTDDAIFEDLTVSEVGAIVQTGNNEFLILGAQNGLTSTESKLQSGQKSGDSSASSITLTGNEQSIYKRLLRTDFNTTLAYLNARTA
tara:strand:+ start:614 stop:1159 length:546 start_codon:yes stop_codon:yes gene_type:complete